MPSGHLVLLLLLLAAVALTIVSGLAFALARGAGPDSYEAKILRLVSLDAEANVPTWFSSALWTSAAVLILVQAVLRRSRPFAWGLFAAVCAYLSLDESATIHEHLNAPMAVVVERIPALSNIQFPWVLPGVVIGLIVAAVLARLIWSLPRRTALQIVVAGVIFGTGAVGIEVVSSLVYDEAATTWLYYSLAMGEEFLEMAGVATLIGALVSLLSLERQPGGTAALHST